MAIHIPLHFSSAIGVTRRRAFLALVALAFFTTGLHAEPRAVSLTPSASTVEDEVIIRVDIHDGTGAAVEATRATPVAFRIRSEDGTEYVHEAIIGAGEASSDVRLHIPWQGTIEISAESRELRGASTLIQSVSEGRAPSMRALMGPQADAGSGRLARLSNLALGGSTRAPAAIADASPGSAAEDWGGAQAADSESEQAIGLRLYLRPRLDVLADGVERATVTAFVVPPGMPAPYDLEVSLLPTVGIPTALTVPIGRTDGHAYITSRQAGTIEVSVEPRGAFEVIREDQPFAVTFAPPISRLALSSSPSSISTFERGEIVARLVGAGNEPIATDVERRVDFTVDGPGALTESVVIIPPGESTARTELRSRRSGLVTVRAHTPSFAEQETHVEIAVLWHLWAVSMLAGVAGGAIRWTRYRDEHLAIGIGGLVGPLGYAVFIYWDPFAGAGISVVNVTGAFVASLVSGWLGTELLEGIGEQVKAAIPKKLPVHT